MIFLIGLCFYFRKEASIFKIIISYVVLAGVMCFGELILLGILHLFVSQVNQMTMLDLPFWLYICQFFMDFILYTLCIQFLSKSVFAYIKENLFLILLYINQMLILYFSVACLIYYPSSIILCIHIVLIVFQIGILLRVYKQSLKKQNEITCQMLEIEYEKQLNEYIKIRGNQEEYRMLRHDVLNYIQEKRR
ncbi:hypothetical protein [Floccifex sp.]|uniref:hypothetical protein n=1 Tax=Floccifex sp. TaxID=2815810 RepID=UPI003F05DC42